MKCPYCSSEMDDGYIPAIKCELEWIPLNKKPSIFIGGKVPGGIKLTKDPWFGIQRKQAFSCKQCKKIIIDYMED